MIEWSKHPEMVEFMKEFIPGHSWTEIREAFEDKFGIVLTKYQIKNCRVKFGVRSGTQGGRFPKGHEPFNKGKKMTPEQYAKASATMFKPGNMPANHKPVGSERVNVDGYVDIKVAEPNKWRLKQRQIWEDHYKEKLTRNDVIIFLDGDKLNLDINNLMKLTRAELVRYNQDHLYCEEREISKAAANIAKIKSRKKR
jgi:hypothetical protein